jgi:hypothetical protein
MPRVRAPRMVGERRTPSPPSPADVPEESILGFGHMTTAVHILYADICPKRSAFIDELLERLRRERKS